MAGSYEALEAGNTGDALVDFTGGVCESVNLKDGGYSQDAEKRHALFKSMERAMREKSLISASIRVNTQDVKLILYGVSSKCVTHRDQYIQCICLLICVCVKR